jgi:hypothetical protein
MRNLCDADFAALGEELATVAPDDPNLPFDLAAYREAARHRIVKRSG